MGVNPVNLYLNPRKKGECFSLPSEVATIKAEFYQFECDITDKFENSFDIWENWELDAQRFFYNKYSDYRFYVKMTCDYITEYHKFCWGQTTSNAVEFNQTLSRGRIHLFAGNWKLFKQHTIQELLNHPEITHLNLGKHSLALQKFCIQDLFREDEDYLAANLMYVGVDGDSVGSYQKILIQGTKKTDKNTLKVRCLIDREVEQILAGFEYAMTQEKYQKLLKATKKNVKELDELYQHVLAFLKNAQKQGQDILYVPTSTKLDLDNLKSI